MSVQRTKKDIYALIQKGETFHLGCKKVQGGLPGSIWESYSAFCNTDGDVILLGAKESLEFEGPETLKTLLKRHADETRNLLEIENY